MSITGLDLVGWISIYLGFSLIRASIPIAGTNNAEYDPRQKLRVPGYCLVIMGALIVVSGLFG